MKLNLRMMVLTSMFTALIAVGAFIKIPWSIFTSHNLASFLCTFICLAFREILWSLMFYYICNSWLDRYSYIYKWWWYRLCNAAFLWISPRLYSSSLCYRILGREA